MNKTAIVVISAHARFTSAMPILLFFLSSPVIDPLLEQTLLKKH
jgi:hypothetical protein